MVKKNLFVLFDVSLNINKIIRKVFYIKMNFNKFLSLCSFIESEFCFRSFVYVCM